MLPDALYARRRLEISTDPDRCISALVPSRLPDEDRAKCQHAVLMAYRKLAAKGLGWLLDGELRFAVVRGASGLYDRKSDRITVDCYRFDVDGTAVALVQTLGRRLACKLPILHRCAIWWYVVCRTPLRKGAASPDEAFAGLFQRYIYESLPLGQAVWLKNLIDAEANKASA
jgi:hypothetical protein